MPWVSPALSMIDEMPEIRAKSADDQKVTDFHLRPVIPSL
jgi:hypothetical protein